MTTTPISRRVANDPAAFRSIGEDSQLVVTRTNVVNKVLFIGMIFALIR